MPEVHRASCPESGLGGHREDSLAADPAGGVIDMTTDVPVMNSPGKAPVAEDGSAAGGEGGEFRTKVSPGETSVPMLEAITVADAAGEGAEAMAREEEIDGGFDPTSGETPAPLLKTMVEPGVPTDALVGVKEGAAEECSAGSSGQAGGKVETGLPAGRDQAATRSIETAGTAEGVDSQQAVDAEEKKGAGGATSEPGGVAIKRRQVSEEERRMAGAPQGEIFDAVMLTTEEQEPSNDVRKAVQDVCSKYEADEWAGRFGAVTAARTLLAHHLTVFDGGQGEEEDTVAGLLGGLVSLVAGAVSDKRSAVQTNGLRCMAELFSCAVGKTLGSEGVGILVRATYGCHQASKGFIVAETWKVMEAAVAGMDPVQLLNSAVLPQALEKHPKVSGQGVIYMDKCLHRLEKDNILHAVLADGVDTELL